MKKFILLSTFGLLFIICSACTKMPEKVKSPSIMISSEIINDNEEYIVRFSGGLENENSNTVLKDLKGTVSILHKDGSLVTLPYDLDKVLPFSMGIIDTEKKIDKNIVIRLTELFRINQEEFEQTKKTDTIYIDDDKVELNIDSYEKEDIVKLLKGIINEEKE